MDRGTWATSKWENEPCEGGGRGVVTDKGLKTKGCIRAGGQA